MMFRFVVGIILLKPIFGENMILAMLLAVGILTHNGQIHRSEPSKNNYRFQIYDNQDYFQDDKKFFKEMEKDLNDRWDRIDRYVDRNRIHHYNVQPDGRGGYDVRGY